MRRTLAVLAVLAAPLAQAAELKVTDSIKGADGGWDLVSVDSEAHRLLVARGDGVMAVDLTSGAVTPTLVPGKRVHMAVSVPGGIGVSTNGDTNDVSLFKVADGTVLGTVAVGKKPDALVYEPKTKLVAVMNAKDGSVSLVDAEKKAVAATIEVGGSLELAVADGTGKVFFNVEDKNELVALDVPGRKVLAHYPLPGCEEPTGLALDSADHILLSSCGNGKAVATSAVDGHVIATLPIGKGPDTVIYDEKNKRFLVPCGEGALYVISAEGGHLTSAGSVPTAKGARTGAQDPATGKVYLPAAEFQPPATPGARPAAVPGSFHLVVLDEK